MYFKEKETPSVPSGISNLVATLDRLDDEPSGTKCAPCERYRVPYRSKRNAVWFGKGYREEVVLKWSQS